MMPEKERNNLLLSLIKTIEQQKISYDRLYCNKDDVTFLKNNLKGKVEVIVRENLHGLVFEIDSPKSVINMSFKELLNEVFEENESKIMELLF